MISYFYSRLTDYKRQSQNLITSWKINPLTFPDAGGNTKTGYALKFAFNNALSPANGARPYVHKVALVLTDGRSQDLVGNPARELRQSGVKVSFTSHFIHEFQRLFNGLFIITIFLYDYRSLVR